MLTLSLTTSQWIRLVLPSVSGFFVSSLPHCRPGKKAGSVVKFRPPGFVFGLVWPVLYLLLGAAWVYAQRHSETPGAFVDICYGMLVFFLTLWIVVYGCLHNKKGGVYVIFLAIFATIMSRDISPQLSRVLLSPLLVWLLFAGLISVFEVQLS